jgi:hypothetical protein
MNNQLERAISLAKKTGDRLIIFDSVRSNSAFVVLSINEYEKLALNKNEVRNLTENELLDRINRDIAVWKNEQFNKEEMARKDRDFFCDIRNKSNINEGRYAKNNLGINPDYFSVVPDFFVTADIRPSFDDAMDGKPSFAEAMAGKKERSKKQWRIPEERKEGAEEVIEEDRQYLEEITY